LDQGNAVTLSPVYHESLMSRIPWCVMQVVDYRAGNLVAWNLVA
jgi:hypothetical protein